MKKNKIVPLLLATAMVCASNVPTFANEVAVESTYVQSEISPRSAVVSIPYYYYVVGYKDGSTYISPTVYHSVTVPPGKKVYVGEAKQVYITDTYNGEPVRYAVRYEYSYSFQ